MDENNTRMKANMERVLRAMDVIPPLRNSNTQPASKAESSRQVPSSPHAERSDVAASQTPLGAAPEERLRQAESKPVIPEFDLGEKILAEQRRMTARKRRRPGASESERGGGVQKTATVPTMLLAAPSADDLRRLQQIVADIVARDIERLCAGPKKAMC